MLLTSLVLLLFPSLSFALPEIFSHPKRTAGGLHLPLFKREVPELERRDDTVTGSIGLGNFRDITYSVLVKVGETETPLVLDTGSSDLWVVSDACTESACSGITLYPQASFQSADLDIRLFYGDSTTGTHAFGEVGKDVVGVAGMSIENQYFAAINDTNTTVLQTGAAGILGLGFPVNSVIWSELFKAQFPTDIQPPTKRSNLNTPKFPDLASLLGGARNKMRKARDLPHIPDLRRTRFPDLASLLPPHSGNSKRQSSASPSLTDLINSFATNGPLISRLAQSALSAPQFTVTLQRDTVQFGGNVGMLSLGELPPGVTNESLTWVPLRGYTPQQGGIASSTDTYPIAWEVPIDDVFIDGQKLPQSTLSPGIALTALIDTGNSLIRGPQDVVQALTTTVTGSSTAATYNCSVPHTLSFQIGGAMFPVDPRDFLSQARRNDVTNCQFNVVSTDPPSVGFLYSWSLGDPFLKSNLVSFYFGNLTHPSQDPPRIGFMSTVQSNAGAQLASAVAAAQASGGNFPAKTESAPLATSSMATTFSGAPQAEPTTSVSSSDSGSIRRPSGARATAVLSWTLMGALAAMVSVWVA